MSQRNTVVYLVTFSAIAAAMIVAVSWQQFSIAPSPGLLDRLLVGSVFIASCVFGISLAIRPGWTRRLIAGKSDEVSRELAQVRGRRGHHPDCEYFDSHTIRWGDRTLCAGCTGLAAGSTVSILLMSLYVALPTELPVGVLHALLVLGLALVAAKYVETVLPLDRAYARLISNGLFIVGFSLLVVGAFVLSGSTVFGILGVVISFLFLDTRIQLSRWRHTKTCRDCSEDCKVYSY